MGVMAFVVQEAADNIVSVSSMSFWLTPITTFLMPLPGAVNMTFDTPLARKCKQSPSSSRHLPVLSITTALLIP